jgi:hypothetical protein
MERWVSFPLNGIEEFLFLTDIHVIFFQVAAKFRSGAVEADSKEVETKDENLAFVAGATGKVGSRAVR